MSAADHQATPVTQDDLERITAEANARAARATWFMPENPDLRAATLRQNLLDHHRCGHLPLAAFTACICEDVEVVTA